MSLSIHIEGWMQPYEYRAVAKLCEQLAEGMTALQLNQPKDALGEGNTTTRSPFTSELADATAPIPTTVIARERGKAAPGRARRTKEEIAEDEAADKAEANTGQSISTGGERVDPEDSAADQDQDAADEATEAASEKRVLTADDLRGAMTAYSNKFSMEQVIADGPAIYADTLGKPPAGNDAWKVSLVPDGRLPLIIDAWIAAAAADKPYGKAV